MDRMRASSIIFLSFFLVASTSAIDILKLLEKESDFSTFSTAVKDSKLADDINNHGSSITVLAVANGAASALSGLSPDEAKKLLATHVLLDYFDEAKLKGLAKKDKPSTVVTMLQTTGKAQHQTSRECSLIEIPDLSPGAAPKAAPAAEDDSDDAAAPSPDDEDPTLSSPPVSGDSPTEAPEAATEKTPEEKPAHGEHAPAPAPSAASCVEMALGAGIVMGLASLFA
ncbi:hypothetical protein ACLB2K_019057 [Fragaria x ananassa]